MARTEHTRGFHLDDCEWVGIYTSTAHFDIPIRRCVFILELLAKVDHECALNCRLPREQHDHSLRNVRFTYSISRDLPGVRIAQSVCGIHWHVRPASASWRNMQIRAHQHETSHSSRTHRPRSCEGQMPLLPPLQLSFLHSSIPEPAQRSPHPQWPRVLIVHTYKYGVGTRFTPACLALQHEDQRTRSSSFPLYSSG
eukprot:scaffold34759_cov37-Tisochrysis_lutea.AAC.3